MKRVFNLFQVTWPFWFLVICGFFFSYNFQQRYDLPVWDEQIYSHGNFLSSHGWSTLYQFYYFILNSFTKDRVLSFDINLYLQSFLLLPLLLALVCTRLGINNLCTFIVGFAALIGSWNFPMEPRVQLFNLVLLLLVFLIRIMKLGLSRIQSLILFYLFLGPLIFIRSDNVFIILIFLIMDAFKLRSVKVLTQILLTIMCSVTVVYLLFGKIDPFDSTRSYKTYADHYYLTFNSHERYQSISHLSPEDFIRHKFANEATLPAILMHMPLNVIEMSWLNIKDFPQSFFRSLSITQAQRKPFFDFWFDPMWSLVILLLISSTMGPRRRSDQSIDFDFFAFSLGITLKCLFISFLLHSWSRYFLEICALFMIWLCFIPVRRTKNTYWVSGGIIFCCLSMLFTFNYSSTFAYFRDGRPYKGREALLALKQLQDEGKAKMVLGGYGIGLWLDNVQNFYVHTICERDQIFNLKDCLDSLSIDTIVLEPEFKNRLLNTKFSLELQQLESSPELFEFKRYFVSSSGVMVLTK